MTISLREIQARHRRLLILSLLSDQSDYTLSHDLLTRAVSALARHVAVGHDQMIVDIFWLRDVGLVTVPDDDARPLLATITERGMDAAGGLVTVPGVDRPAPGTR